jgi:hypothetical protein
MVEFEKTLRLNLLEIVNYSKIRKNRKRYSLADILNQINAIYQVSNKKPDIEQIADAMDYLLQRSLIEVTEVGEVDMFYISEKGRDLLQMIAEGDDTAII